VAVSFQFNHLSLSDLLQLMSGHDAKRELTRYWRRSRPFLPLRPHNWLYPTLYCTTWMKTIRQDLNSNNLSWNNWCSESSTLETDVYI